MRAAGTAACRTASQYQLSRSALQNPAASSVAEVGGSTAAYIAVLVLGSKPFEISSDRA